MKMKTNKFMTYALSAMMLGSLAACSSDDSEPDNGGNSGGETTDTPYVWGTEGSIKTCDHLLFNEDKSENKKGTVIGNGDQEFVFKGTQTLAKGTYLLKGWVYVGAGSTLTIEPGTVIKGDKDTQAALIIEPGGKLIAEGKQDAPIVFTSEMPKGQRKPGDWGGLIICGKAKNNQGVLNQQIEGGPRTKHGGDDDSDNSGIIRYVRVEFAGYPFMKDKEINGITFGSVGSGTTIDHLQVSYSNDDSYEWFGGSVNLNIWLPIMVGMTNSTQTTDSPVKYNMACLSAIRELPIHHNQTDLNRTTVPMVLWFLPIQRQYSVTLLLSARSDVMPDLPMMKAISMPAASTPITVQLSGSSSQRCKSAVPAV